MCGIALLFDYGVNSENTQKRQRIVENMIYAQIHRGRDSKTINHYSTCSVAFNRLAITEIDKSQPSQGDWKVYLNGEIYNYKELGYTGSEVEIISQGIKEHGMSFINKLNGIFVIIAINNREVYVIRDRYGCKPLYYWDNGKEIVIASEIKAILKHPGYKTSINYSAKRQWLVFNNVLTDETLFNGIKKLDKGTIWHLNTGRKIKYWSWKFNPIKMDIEDAKIEVFKLITKSVSRQIPSGIKAGIFASGGVDSNIIRVLASQLQSYTASFPGYEIDELDYARLVGPTKAIEFNSIKRFKETIYHLEDLRVGASWTNYCLYEEASKDGCKVILDGAGSDELFGGYSWRYSAENYYDVVNRTKISDQFCFDLFRNKFNDSLIERYLFDAEYFLEGVLLVGDKLGMAHTIEVRVPFLDNELVDFCLTIPNELKENKLILKQAFSELLPKEIIQGKKKGFSSPDWFDGPGNQARKWSENALNQWKQLYDITGAL